MEPLPTNGANCPGTFAATNLIDMYSSLDGGIWKYEKSPQCSPYTLSGNAWAPEWFIDKDYSIHVVCNAAATDSSGGHQPYEIHPTTSDLRGSWSAPAALTGTNFPGTATDIYDWDIRLIGTTYHAFLHCAAGCSGIYQATATALMGPWTILSVGTSDPYSLGPGEGPYQTYSLGRMLLTGDTTNGTYMLYSWSNNPLTMAAGTWSNTPFGDLITTLYPPGGSGTLYPYHGGVYHTIVEGAAGQ